MIFALNFAAVQVLPVHSTGLSAIYVDQIDPMEQATTNLNTSPVTVRRIMSFYEIFCPELARPWGWPLHPSSKPIEVDRLKRVMCFSDLLFPFLRLRLGAKSSSFPAS